MQFGWLQHHLSYRVTRMLHPTPRWVSRPITHAALEEDALYGLQLDGMSFEMLITMLETMVTRASLIRQVDIKTLFLQTRCYGSKNCTYHWRFAWSWRCFGRGAPPLIT